MRFIISGRRIKTMKNSNKNVNVWILVYGILLLVMSIPLLCEYVPEGGNVLFWLEKIERYNVIGLTLTNKYRVFILIINIITLFGTYKLMRIALEDDIAVFFGTCFYTLCPYRIYVCYDSVELDKAIQMMILPIIMIGVFAKGKFVISKKVVSGVLLVCMGIYMMKGQSSYTIGEMLTSYTYTEGKPGIGLAMIACVLLTIWLLYTESDKTIRKELEMIWIVSILLFACYALALPFLSILSARTIKLLRENDQKFVGICIPIMILFANFGVALYLCNNIVYTRLPMFLINSIQELVG